MRPRPALNGRFIYAKAVIVMAEQAPMADAGTQQEPTAGEQPQAEYVAPATQADLDRIIGESLSRERSKFADYEDIKAKAAKFDEVENANKSDLQRLEERAAAAEAKVARFEAAEQRAQWAAEIVKDSAVPASALRGETREELEAHFAELQPLIGQAQVPDLRASAGQRVVPAAEASVDDWLRNQRRR